MPNFRLYSGDLGVDANPKQRNSALVREFFERVTAIRMFEEALLHAFRDGRLTGTTHTSIGQEIIAVAAARHLCGGDVVVSNHRCHAHYLACGGDEAALLSEIVGLPTGLSGGRGGSQHLHDARFFSNGIQGGMLPVAAGLAWARVLRGEAGVVVCYMGDGTFGEGIVYETLNMIALWRIPVLLVVENNEIAQTTPIERNLAGTISGRIAAFGIAVDEVGSDDAVDLDRRFADACRYVRERRGPYCQIVRACRIGPHSKGDDVRPPEVRNRVLASDPLLALRAGLDPEVCTEIESREQGRIANVFSEVLSTPSVAETDLPLAADGYAVQGRFRGWVPVSPLKGEGRRLSEVIGITLFEAMSSCPEIHLLGEDILDPYGGAFKVTRGLSTAFPDRVHASPISEAGLVGISNGLALAGLRPVVEVMFGDFLSLTFDQLLNHAAKFPLMYGHHGPACPVVVRTPMGGYRGYGPTHSQSLEKHFLGIPGLVTTAMSPFHDIETLWQAMLECDCPVLHVENKSLYGTFVPVIDDGRWHDFVAYRTSGRFPTVRLRLRDVPTPASAAIVAYGGMAQLALDAARQAFISHEFDVEVVVPSLLSPVPTVDLASALKGVAGVVVLEEGTLAFGWGAEIAAQLSVLGGGEARRIKRVATPDAVISNSGPEEARLLPNVDRVVAALREVVR